MASRSASSRQGRRFSRGDKSKATVVSFGTMTIREFAIAPAPHCVPKEGVPLGMSRKPVSMVVLDIHDYEQNRPRRRRSTMLDVETRTSLLLGEGYTYEDVADLAIRAHNVREQREETWQALNKKSLGKLANATGKAFKNLLSFNGLKSNNVVAKMA